MAISDIFKKKSSDIEVNSFGNTAPANRMGAGSGTGAALNSQPKPVSQPIDPDEFFARPERKPKAAKTAEIPQEIDTSDIDPDKVLRGEDEVPAVNYDYSKDKNMIETDNIDPDQVLRGEGQAPAFNYDFSKDDNFLSTDDVNTDVLRGFAEPEPEPNDDIFVYPDNYYAEASAVEFSE